MGADGSKLFSAEDLQVYEAVTCLFSGEVLLLRQKFEQLLKDDKKRGGTAPPGKLAMAKMVAQEEFRNNPFRYRLCQAFSSEPLTLDDGSVNPDHGALSWDEYVDLFSCLSPKASLDVKMQTAFRMFDFDQNGYLTVSDLNELLMTIATPKGKPCLMKKSEIESVCERVMRDCDIDGNGRLSYDYPHVENRAPSPIPSPLAIPWPSPCPVCHPGTSSSKR